MVDRIARKRLAERLGEIAREIGSIDGDFVAQTAVYSMFLEHWEDQASEASGDYGDLISAASDRGLIDQARTQLTANPLPFSDYLAEGKDPQVYFYEDFLRAYDSKASKGRGVHYSPPAAVGYMVRGVESILREQFGDRAGQATILDPCCGIGTFLRAIAGSGLPRARVVGMELSAPACALASRLTAGCEILNVDSLQEIDLGLGAGPLVVIGNPPYSGHSSNAGAVAELLADYRAGLSERNPKWLQDDYVKFIRMAQHRIDQVGSGVLAFITNHSYLVNPTFRAMRVSLMDSFDQVFALNLYGNALTNRESETPDENIFSIRMGVAIVFMVKNSGSAECDVMHAGIRGSRINKLEALDTLGMHDTPWEPVLPAKPFSVFVPTNASLQTEFYGFVSLFDLFKESSIGFVTSRDSFAVDTDRDALLARIADLRNPQVSPNEIRASYAVTDMDIERARRELLDDAQWEERAVEVLYRPFDKRWAYYSRAIMERPRLPFMEHLMNENIALAIGRAGQVTGSQMWDVVFCTDAPADLNLFRRGGAMLFPLYRYDGGQRLSNMVQHDAEFFNYAYAVMHSKTYRERYGEFLAVDYPRIPLSRDSGLVGTLSQMGKDLADAHLMRVDCCESLEIAPIRVGGWDVPGKYLKDRKSRTLTGDEQLHVAKMQLCVARALAIQEMIEETVIQCPPWSS